MTLNAFIYIGNIISKDGVMFLMFYHLRCFFVSDPNKSAELMQRLVGLSAKQSGQKMDIDPMSGADRATSR